MKIQIVYGLDQIPDVVEKLYALLPQCQVITFTGSLGAGKTTLARALLRRCGVTDVITSPTFTYVNIYQGADDTTIYHFDCYRIKTLDEFNRAGFDEYLYQPHSIALIEWPEIVLPIITHNVCHVTIDYQGDKRVITLEMITA